MKISGPGRVSPPSVRRAAKTGGADGFAPSAPASENRPAAAPVAAAGVAGVDALLALQGTGDALEAKKRAARRASGLLDALDDLRLSLLDGASPQASLQRLQAAARERRDATYDPGLETVLDAVEVRAAVELAKRERA